MNKNLQLILRMLVGGAIGFFLMYWMLSSPLEGIAFSEYSVWVNGFLLVVLIGLLLFSLIRYRQIQRLLNQPLTGDAEDAADQQMYRWFSDGTLSLNLVLPLSLVLVSVNLVLDQQLSLVVTLHRNGCRTDWFDPVSDAGPAHVSGTEASGYQ